MGLMSWLVLAQSESNRALGLESSVQYRERWISIRIFYFGGFLLYFAFNLVVAGLWPYLKILDPEADKTFLPYLFAMPSVMQLVCSPIFGWWNNRLSSARTPIVVVLAAFVIGHVAFAVLEDVPIYRKEFLLLSRAVAGLATITSTIYRAYISSATTVAERTQTVSHINLAQSLGLLAGSAMQPVLALLGTDGFLLFGFIRFNMFTSMGWISAVLGCILIVLMMPCIFKDHHIAVREIAMLNGKAGEENVWNPDPVRSHPIVLMLVTFSLAMFGFKAVQSLLSPIALDQFGWNNEESLFYLGILMTVGALISCILFLMLDPMCKRFGESNVLVYGAMFALLVSQLLLIPFGKEPITSYIDVGNSTSNLTTSVGCPPTQEWCQRIPPIGKIQFTISYTMLCVSFSIGTTLSQAVFSKLLGPRPQGTWMALLTCAGSFARILGPGSVTVYVLFGTYWTFGAGAVLSGLVFLWMWIYRESLEPVRPDQQPDLAEELKVLNSTKLRQ